MLASRSLNEQRWLLTIRRCQSVRVKRGPALDVTSHWRRCEVDIDYRCLLVPLLGWLGSLECRESFLAAVNSVGLGLTTHVAAVAGQSKVVLVHIGCMLGNNPWGHGRATRRTAASIREGEASDTVELLHHGSVLRALHWRVTGVDMVKAVVHTEVG